MDRQEQIQEARRSYMRSYMRSYRKKNKEKIKQYADTYWARQASVEMRSLQSFERELKELKYGAN
jgi:hypothetical protein